MSTLLNLDQSVEAIRQEQDILTKVKLLGELLQTGQIKLQDIASKLKVTASYLCHLMRLKKLPEAVMDGYYSGVITLSHLFIISRLSKKEDMIELYEKVLSGSLSVAKTEELVRDLLFSVKTIGEYINPEEKNKFVQAVTSGRKDMRVSLIQTRIKSKFVIEVKGDLVKTSTAMREFMRMF